MTGVYKVAVTGQRHELIDPISQQALPLEGSCVACPIATSCSAARLLGEALLEAETIKQLAFSRMQNSDVSSDLTEYPEGVTADERMAHIRKSVDKLLGSGNEREPIGNEYIPILVAAYSGLSQIIRAITVGCEEPIERPSALRRMVGLPPSLRSRIPTDTQRRMRNTFNRLAEERRRGTVHIR
ncbi:hypothetical protein JNM87_00320 [Candidatus Saccharibacteria bacterium]|nr:hypothetical protein [Candidatus Saccharibacteria bacterium]